MSAAYHLYGERSRKILALLPKNGNVSEPDESSDDDVSDDELERKVSDFFHVLEDRTSSEQVIDCEERTGTPIAFELDVPNSLLSKEFLLSPLSPVVEQLEPIQEATHEELPAAELCQPGPSGISESSLQSVSPAKANRTRAKRRIISGSESLPKKVIKKCPPAKILKQPAVILNWEHGDLKDGGVTLPDPPGCEPQDNELCHPVDIFYEFFTEELIANLVKQTKLYATQKTGNTFAFTREDCLDFIAVELLMGVVGMPAYRDYWSRDLRYDKIANTMSVNKYESIRRFFHISNNEDFNEDPYYKVRPVLDYIREKCREIDVGEKKFAIDEAIIPYKGKKAGNLRQYAPDKPNKWGFKFYVRSGTSGIVYDFIPYCGSQTFSPMNTNSRAIFTRKEEGFNITEKCVVALIKSITDKPLSSIYCDNYYSSPRLMLHLRENYGIFALGTFRSNRCSGAQHILSVDKDLIKQGRGSMDSVVDESRKIILTKWVDNKVVLIGSTYVGVEPTGFVKRWSKEARDKVDIPAPRAICEYNAFMGGVDLSDMLCSLYRTPLRTHKYYSALICWLIDISIINSWRLYLKARPDSRMTCKQFRIRVADELLLYRRPKRGRPRGQNSPRGSKSPTPPPSPRRKSDVQPLDEAIMKDGVGHLPVYKERGKCRYCHTGYTNVQCEKCKIRFCCTPKRNCFTQAHR